MSRPLHRLTGTLAAVTATVLLAASPAAASAGGVHSRTAPGTTRPHEQATRTERLSLLFLGTPGLSSGADLKNRLRSGVSLAGSGWYRPGAAPTTPAQIARFRERTQGSYDVPISQVPPPPTAPNDPDLRRITLDPITTAECWKNATAHGSGQQIENVPGWVKNHYAWCSAVPIAVANVVRIIHITDPSSWFDTEIVTATARLTVVGLGSPNQRKVTFTMGIDQAQKDPDFGDLTLGFTAGCDAGPVHCDGQGDTNRQMSLEDWNAQGPQGTSFSFTTDPGQGQGLERRAEAVFKTALQGFTTGGLADQTTNFLTSPMNGPRTTMRFDSAPYMQQAPWNIGSQGAIFDNVSPHLIYSLAGPEKDVAEHIQQALQKPGTTFPPDPNKKIPGDAISRALHRLLSDDWTPIENGDNPTANPRYNRNRAVVRAACRQLRRQQPPTGITKPQCDEFPFASSYEGAAASQYETNWPYGFSVKYVPGASNGSAGGQLSYWYYSDRILDRDAYYVQIVP